MEERSKEPDEEHVPFQDYGTQPPAGKPQPRERREVRRPSPLGLMGPPTEESPKESGLPSVRAIGIMLIVVALVLILIFVLTRA